MLVESAEELQWKIYEERVRWGLDGCPREKKSLVLSVDIVFSKELLFWLLCRETWGWLQKRCYKTECFKPGARYLQKQRTHDWGRGMHWVEKLKSYYPSWHEFEILREGIENCGICVNIVANEAYVPEVER